ncbi:sulfur carrier protein ThiS [Oryzibacter oryziterrae]|uniref:sulfur carrier protein ThiS n=1 Tax=Oryzibacter oryziterrae TaxID=2766474 RepID=UPI001EFFD527|nr:sulfur carrier protein ThiS [Oryzibacter oryziterrae]
MRVLLNGEEIETEAADLAAFVTERAFDPTVVATALNNDFVPRGQRGETVIRPGDRIEIVSPRQGG